MCWRQSFGLHCCWYHYQWVVAFLHPEELHLEHTFQTKCSAFGQNARLSAILKGWKGVTANIGQEKKEQDQRGGHVASEFCSTAPATALLPFLIQLQINPLSIIKCYGHLFSNSTILYSSLNENAAKQNKISQSYWERLKASDKSLGNSATADLTNPLACGDSVGSEWKQKLTSEDKV